MSTTLSSGPLATLNAPRTGLALLTYVKAVYDAMLNNPNFPSPTPTLASFATDIAALENAETKAATKAKGSAALRNAKRKKVRDTLNHLRDYVQSVAETQATPAEATAIIASALMSVRKPTSRQKSALSAKNAGTSGSVVVEARAVARQATYYWEYSLDQKTWTIVPETMTSKITLTGLTSAQTYYFRFRALTRAGQRDYSQVVSLLVH